MTRRSNGTRATDYVLHVPKTFDKDSSGRLVATTCCGRVSAEVNCIGDIEEVAKNREVVCRRCARTHAFLKVCRQN